MMCSSGMFHLFAALWPDAEGLDRQLVARQLKSSLPSSASSGTLGSATHKRACCPLSTGAPMVLVKLGSCNGQASLTQHVTGNSLPARVSVKHRCELKQPYDKEALYRNPAAKVTEKNRFLTAQATTMRMVWSTQSF